jgi:hypothetical protein
MCVWSALWSLGRVLEEVRARATTAFSPFELDTARAALIYRSFAGRASAGQNTARALHQALLVPCAQPPVFGW